jgi:hypothetical protein
LIGLAAFSTPCIFDIYGLLFAQPAKARRCIMTILPARFARLAWVTTVVIAPPSAAPAAKTLSAAFRTVRFWFRFVNGQRSSTQFRTIEGRDRFIRRVGIGHFYECEPSRPARIPIRNQAHLVDCAVRLEHIA